ncbi:MAG: fused MFS/spermidine synthase [Acidobacteria bacterium]|nr:fused MFS/spermidine synthase [Acidobacteriota bacterium]
MVKQGRPDKRVKTRSSAARGGGGALPSGGLASPFDRTLLYLAVFLTGAAIMMIEVLGTRILGPFYGVSLFVWSSLISVTLIALALGYYLGGIAADRAKRFQLSHGIALAALSTALIPVFKTSVLLQTNVLGVRAGAFCSALLLFSVPLTLLAMVGPRVIKLCTSRLESVGRSSGSVYAFSTVGGVLGTLVLGFFLLPMMGTRTILYGVSVGLLVLAAVLALHERARMNTLGLLVLPFVSIGIVGILVFFGGERLPTTSGFTTVYEAQSIYGRVRVVDESERHLRWLLSDSSTIGAIDLRTGEPEFPYLYILEALPRFHPQGRSALLIGLGAGLLPKLLGRYGIETDSIEIDPEVARAARDYFGFNQTGRLILGDARYEVRRLKKKYDFIIHDCFSRGVVPAHLLSVEMLEDLRSLLNDGGVLALNFYGYAEGERALPAAAVAKTIEAVFPFHRVFVSALQTELTDHVFFASTRPLLLKADEVDIPPSPLGKLMLDNLLRYEHKISNDQGFVITDDFNPLESMQVRKAEIYRHQLLSDISADLLAR